MRRVLIGTGALLMAYAVGGALRDPDLDLLGVVIFLAAVLIVHDAVFLPLVIAAGTLPRRPDVRYAGVVSLALLVVGLPPALGFGRSPDDSSVLPLAYGRNLILILGSVWLAALLPRALRRIRKGSESSPAEVPRPRDG